MAWVLEVEAGDLTVETVGESLSKGSLPNLPRPNQSYDRKLVEQLTEAAEVALAVDHARILP
jgi:hypothetical protein